MDKRFFIMIFNHASFKMGFYLNLLMSKEGVDKEILCLHMFFSYVSVVT